MRHSLIKNFASLTGAEIVSKVVTFAAFAYLARLFGPAGYGYIEWAGTVLMCGSLIVDQGFNSYGAREVAKHPAETPRLVAEVVTARFILAGVAYALISAFALLYVRDREVARLLLIYGLSLWLLPVLLQWVFQGHDQMHLVGVAQVIRQLIFVTIVFVFVKEPANLLWVGAAEVAGVAAASFFCVYVYSRYYGRFLAMRPTLSTMLFREGTPIGISQMLWVLKMFGATFIVGLIATSEDTGYFAAAMRIYIALHAFVWLYFFNLLPAFSRAWEKGSEHLVVMIRKSLRIILVGSLVSGAIWIAAAPFVMTTAYGQDFLLGGRALQWLAGACIVAALSGSFRYALIASGNQRKELLATASGSLTAIALIPAGYIYFGVSGSAAALLLAEVVVLFCSWMATRRSVISRAPAGIASRAALREAI